MNLIRHLKNVKWSSNKSVFARSPDNGHYDAVDALIYLIRNIVYSKNPYPASYGLNLNAKDVFVTNYNKFNETSHANTYRAIFNVKKKVS